MNRLRQVLLQGALCLVALWVGGFAAAQDTQNRAGLVIDYGDGTVTYAVVPFEEASISGIELLERSGVPLVTVDFGGLGEGVCTIGEQGCGVGVCRQRVCQSADPDSPFWQYFRLSDAETWTPLVLGASSARVENGSIEGWSWTGTEPRLPVVDLQEIEAVLDVDFANGQLPGATVRTFDAGGQMVGPESRRSSNLSYIAALFVVVALIVVAGLLMVRRNREAVSKP